MSIKVLEGRWEDIAPQVKLSGRSVRIVYQDRSDAVITLAETTSHPAASPSSAAWLKQLIAFSNSHKSPEQEIDLDRDRLFEELHPDCS